MAGKSGHRAWGWIRKLPSGRFQASYLHNGVRHTAPTTFTSRTAAEGWLATERQRIEHDVIGGAAWTPPKAPEKAALDAYVVAVDPNTHRSYYPVPAGSDGRPALLEREPS